MAEMISDEKWTAWTNKVLEWGESFDSHLETLKNAPEGQFVVDDEEMEEGWNTIQNKINRGNRKPANRDMYKEQIHKEGAKYPNWPHGRGASSTLQENEKTSLDRGTAVEQLAAQNYYRTYVENDAAHLLVKRASNANKIDGVAYETESEFVEAQVKSMKSTLRGFIRDGHWGTTDDEGNRLPLAFEHPIVRPFTEKVEATVDDSDDESGE